MLNQTGLADTTETHQTVPGKPGYMFNLPMVKCPKEQRETNKNKDIRDHHL